MKVKALLLSVFLMAFTITSVYGQRAEEQYDATDTTLGPEAGTSLVQDLDQIKQQAIENIIKRIQKGDVTVLKFVVYDVFAEVHKELVLRTRKHIAEGMKTDFYREVGNNAALAAYIGGLDNQDPKVRLRCIGFLGDWVEDIGEEMPRIAKAANDRLNSGIETREEVKYGLELLQLKVLRKINLNKVYNGNEELLKTIDPEEFIVLVHGEDFIRQIFCVPPEVILRSIRLDPWWIEQKSAESYRVITEADFRTNVEEQSKASYPSPFKGFQDLEYQYKLEPVKSVYRNYPEVGAKAYGYKDRAGFLDIVSLYDFRYFRYSETGKDWPKEAEILRAIFNGIANDSLFVRENCARVIVRMSDGRLGTAKGNVQDNVSYENADINNNTPYEIKDETGRVKSVKGNLGELGKNARYQQIAKTAWDEVKYSQYVDVHLGFEINEPTRRLDPIDGVKTYRSRGKFVCGDMIPNPWGYTYNYRTDMADILRRMNLGSWVDTCDREPVKAIAIGRGQYFVEDLFDPDEFDEVKRNRHIADWHGRDEIKDEVFERYQ